MIAFLILAHADPCHVARLVNKLKPHKIFIHLDKKTEMNEKWNAIDAQFIEDRVPVYWAGYSQIQASLNLIRFALNSGGEYEKLVLLSGSCYPIRPIAELEKLFFCDNGHNYITYVSMRDSAHLMTLIEKKYYRDGIFPYKWTANSKKIAFLEKLLRFAREKTVLWKFNKWPLEITPYHGSQWWALTPECADYVIKYIDEHKEIADIYRTRFAPDEQFFSTIIGNSIYSEKSTGQIPYTGRGTWKTANLHWIAPSLSKWLSVEDFEELIKGGKFFARKMQTEVSSQLLDLIDVYLADYEINDVAPVGMGGKF